MKQILSAIIAILLFAMPVKAQQVTADSLYLQAYTEIADMLDGKQPLSVKRAVFLSEWAYLGGRLDYQRDFCDEISRIANYIRNVIALNHFETYKTAKEFSICNYFFRPCNGNGGIPYTYDYNEEFPRGDWRHQFVSRTLKSHKGQCHSLPMTFKLIAEELGAKAYIAQTPCHSYIVYKDEDDHYPEDWVNVELTSHQYVPTFSIKEHYMISDSAVNVGTYMTPLTDVQTVANQLSDLAMGYLAKYSDHYDIFSYTCAAKALQYNPTIPNAIIIAGKSLQAMLRAHLAINGGLRDAFTDEIDRLSIHYWQMLESTYWTDVTEEQDEQWANEWKTAPEPQILTREKYEQMVNKK